MVLPLAVPGLLTVVIFALTLPIQEFVYSLTFISAVGRMSVSVGVPVALVRGDAYYWGSLMAACPHHERAAGDALQPLPRSGHRRAHGRRHQVADARPKP